MSILRRSRELQFRVESRNSSTISNIVQQKKNVEDQNDEQIIDSAIDKSDRYDFWYIAQNIFLWNSVRRNFFDPNFIIMFIIFPYSW